MEHLDHPSPPPQTKDWKMARFSLHATLSLILGGRGISVPCYSDRDCSIPSGGGVAILSVASCYRNQDELRPCGPPWLVCDFTFICLLGIQTSWKNVRGARETTWPTSSVRTPARVTLAIFLFSFCLPVLLRYKSYREKIKSCSFAVLNN